MSDIERRENSSESLELLQERNDLALQSPYDIQEVLLDEYSKPNIVKFTRTIQIFYQVIRRKLISCQPKNVTINTAQKMKFCNKDFFSKCDQIRRKLRIGSHLLKKSLKENFIFCAV